jgi:hypothetical protein
MGLDGSRWAVWAPSLASIFRGGPYSVPVSVDILTEAFALEQLPRLIDINRGGHFKVSASVNRF